MMRALLVAAVLLAPLASVAQELMPPPAAGNEQRGTEDQGRKGLEASAPRASSSPSDPVPSTPPVAPSVPPFLPVHPSGPWYPAPYPVYPVPYPYGYPPAPPPPVATVEAAPPPLAPPEPPYTGPSPSRASWALQIEAARGVATGEFGNALVGGHVDYRFSSRTSLGGYLALANLKGKDGRVNAALPCALITYEKLRPGHALSFPVEFATGYLTQNGPVARLAAGAAWAIGQRTDVILGIASMAWVTRDDMLLSLNLALELRRRSP